MRGMTLVCGKSSRSAACGVSQKPTITEWAVLREYLSAGSWVVLLLILGVARIAVKAEVVYECRCHRGLSCSRWTLLGVRCQIQC